MMAMTSTQPAYVHITEVNTNMADGGQLWPPLQQQPQQQQPSPQQQQQQQRSRQQQDGSRGNGANR